MRETCLAKYIREARLPACAPSTSAARPHLPTAPFHKARVAEPPEGDPVARSDPRHGAYLLADPTCAFPAV